MKNKFITAYSTTVRIKNPDPIVSGCKHTLQLRAQGPLQLRQPFVGLASPPHVSALGHDGEGGDRDMFIEAYEALISVGHSAQDARTRIDNVRNSGTKCKSVEDILAQIYQNQRES